MKLKRSQRRRKMSKRLMHEGLESRMLMAAEILATTTVGSDQVMQTYDHVGALIASEVIPSGGYSAEKARDLVVGSDGDVHVFNGTSSPHLSTLDSGGNWDHLTTQGWSTFSSSYYGGIGQHENFVFVTDMWGAGGGAPRGIVRFDLDTGTAERFDNFYSYTDLTVGQDGLLYALSHRTIRAYDPNSLALQKTVNLPFSVDGQSQVYRGIAVDSGGEIIAASWRSQIHRFDADGNVLESTTVSSPGGLFGDFTDIDLSTDGRLALGTYWGYIVQMNDDFTNTTYIDTGNSSVFVAFAESAPATPTVSIGDAQVTEGDSGLVLAQFEATLSQPSTSQVHFLYETHSGTATEGVDFARSHSAVTFFPGEVSKTINVFVYGDETVEDDEVFEVELTQAFGATLGDSLGVGTIINDDSLTMPDLSIANTTASESDGSSVFVVTLTQPSSSPVTFDYSTRNGSAQSGSDFLTQSGSHTIAPGQTSVELEIDVYDDVLDEMTETFYLDIANAQGANIADGSGLAFLYDNDTALLSVTDLAIEEGDSGTKNANFAVQLSTPSAFNVRVDYATQDGTASSGSDFLSQSGQLVFAPGETEKIVSVPVLGDQEIESDEEFDLVLSSAFFAGIADASGTAQILDDDVSPITVSIGNEFGSERFGDEFSFLISLSEPSSEIVSVDYSNTVTQGDAIAGTDFAATAGTVTFQPGETEKEVFVQVYDDSIDELTETFYVDLQNASGAIIDQGNGTGWIADDDRSVLSVSSPEITEGDSGTKMLTFDVSLSQSVSRAVDVNYETEDFTATQGLDYGATAGVLTFAPGETLKTVSVEVYGDDLTEPDEVFHLNAEAIISFETNETYGRGKINDDDYPTITVGDSQVMEGDNGTSLMVFTLQLSNPNAIGASVTYSTLDQTATAGEDYHHKAGSVVFAPFASTATVTVLIIGDQLVEADDEEFSLVLHNSIRATIATPIATGTIIDDDGNQGSQSESGDGVLSATPLLSLGAGLF